MNIQQMMKQAQQMQERLKKQMAELRVEATAGGGMVTVVVNGDKQLAAPEDRSRGRRKEDVEMLQDLILAAVNDAQRKADEQMAQTMGGMMGGLKIPRPSMMAPVRSVFCPIRLPIPYVTNPTAWQRLPGIGAKGAQRLAFHILKTPRERPTALAPLLLDVKDRVTYCSVCNNITDVDPCPYCDSMPATIASSASSKSRRTSAPSRRRASSRACITC